MDPRERKTQTRVIDSVLQAVNPGHFGVSIPKFGDKGYDKFARHLTVIAAYRELDGEKLVGVISWMAETVKQGEHTNIAAAAQYLYDQVREKRNQAKRKNFRTSPASS